MKIHWSSRAKEDLLGALSHYGDVNVSLQAAFWSCLECRMNEIGQHPLACRIVRQRSRRANLPRFPYCLLYSVEDEVIWVLAVLHQARHPRHFFGRLP